MWGFLVSQDVPGIVIGSVLSAWATAVPIGAWIHRVTERRHQQRLAATRQLATQLRRKA